VIVSFKVLKLKVSISIFLAVTNIEEEEEKERKNSRNRWLASYDARRTSGEAEMSQLFQVRPDLIGLSWDEVRETEVPQLSYLGETMNIGQSFSQLKKSWRSYKLYRKEGMPAPDLAFRILKIQKSLGLPLSQFDELDQSWVDQELAMMDETLLEEEEKYVSDSFDFDEHQLTPLEQQLIREERESLMDELRAEEWYPSLIDCLTTDY
jgi:hypothetical protein